LIEADIRDAISCFEDAEVTELPQVAGARRPSLAAVGSVARKALLSPLLRDRLAQQDVKARAYQAYSDLDDLLQKRDWSLALVLSPFKQAVKNQCDALTASAERSGVIDTIIYSETGKRIGVNTNAMGAGWAMRHLMGNEAPQRCLIAGTGASARSCIVALRDSYGELKIGVVGRSPDRTSSIAEEFYVSIVEDISEYAPQLVINATTVGETSDENPQFTLEKAFVAGTRYFDLNNRTSALQIQALQHGCVTMSGILMQTIVNALRVHLLTRRSKVS
jgi:shikimate dehydrogenase